MEVSPYIVTLLFTLNFHCSLSAPTTKDPHGGVKMGISNNRCDDAKTKLEVDWDNSTNFEYTCQREESIIRTNKKPEVLECIPKEDMPQPLHKCMSTVIQYDDTPPRAGPHRPLWPVYGEYIYAPPQRWIHSLEHGAAVFLYHPCADRKEIEKFKSLAVGCLRKHVITPYRKLPLDKSFAVLTYGCRMMLGHVDEEIIVDYVRKYALTAPEATPREGMYTLGLLHKSDIVTDFEDSGTLCPGLPNKKEKEPEAHTENKLNPEERIDLLEKRLGKRVIM